MKLINTRTNEKEDCSWDQIFNELDYFIKYPGDTPDPVTDYKETFGHAPKVEEKKPSAVTVSEKAKPKTDKKPQKANEKPKKTEWTDPKLEELPEKAEEPEEAAGEEVPYPDGEEPEITHVSPEDPLPEEDSEAAGVEEEIAPAQPETEHRELTSFQKQVIDKLKLVESIIGSMETTKESWNKVNDMLRDTITLINKSTF